MADAPTIADRQPQPSNAAASAQAPPPATKVIVVIATGWGPLYGGINSFSFDLCLALGCILRGSARVICLTTNVDDLTRRRVKSDQVEIFTLPKVGPGNEPVVASDARTLLNQNGVTEISLVFGHDVVTGPAAIELAGLMGGKAALFHHMSYIQYQGLKKDGRSAVEMDAAQKGVLERADYVIAVGPLLKESAQRLLQRGVPMVVPGMATIRPITHRAGSAFRAITFGRMGGDDDPIKQGSLAVAGYGRYVKQAHEKRMDRMHGFTMYGLSQAEYEAEEQAIKERMRREAARQIPVNATVYTNDRQELFTALADNEVALMLSWHEGFGLTGWEAIAAGVPLVVSKQTGLYKLLDAPGDLGGAANVSVVDVRGSDGGVPDDADVTDVAGALFQISANWEKFHQKAITLRDYLAKKYTWEGCATAALKACDFPFVPVGHETGRSSEGLPSKPGAYSKVGFLALLGLLLLGAMAAAVLILPRGFGPGARTEHGDPTVQSSDDSGTPSPEVKKEPQGQLKPARAETLTCYLGDGAEAKRPLFPLKCVGGRANGRIHLVPAQLADSMRFGSTLVWVASCAPYRHLPPEDKKPKPPLRPDGPAFSFVYMPADKHLVEVEGVSVYELRATGEAAALVHVGEVELNAYKELVEKGAVTVNSKPERVLYLRTGPGDHRRIEVTAVRCADGPAAKKYLPVLREPEKAVADGATLWPVLDLGPRPPDEPGLVLPRRGWDAPSHVAHLNWYRLERREGGDFEALYDFHSDAEEYAARHLRPLGEKLPLLLKELEKLKGKMSDDIALVRKDYAANKIHASGPGTK
jgi:glycosyltransferase involved in cell wall biosynthesis